MPNVTYLSPGQPLSAEKWTALWSEADARLFKLYSGLPPCLWASQGLLGDSRFQWNHARRFYFWNGDLPAVRESYGEYKTVAQAFFGRDTYDFGSIIFNRATDPWVHVYSHTPFTDLVAELDLDDPDGGGVGRPAKSDEWMVARLKDLDSTQRTTYANAIWGVAPSGVFDPSAALLYSLEHHKREFESVPDGPLKDYSVYIRTLPPNRQPELRQRWTPIDVYIGEGFGGGLTWPANYNKYQFVRFSNLTEEDVTVTWHYASGDSFELVVPAMRCKCVRQTSETGGAYVSSLNYFHTMLPQDPWWVGLTVGAAAGDTTSPSGSLGEITDGYNHIVTDPLIVAQMLSKQDPMAFYKQWGLNPTTLGRLLFRGANLWGGVGIYNSPGYVGGSKCRPTPSGGFFGDISSDATPLGDLIIHKGTMMNARDMGGYVALRRTFEFTGMGSLAGGLASVGITLTVPGLGGGSATMGSDGGETDGGVLIGLSCNLMQALFGKAADIIPGGASNELPKLIGIPILTSAVVEEEIEVDYNTWVYNSGSDDFSYDVASVFFTKHGRAVGGVTTDRLSLFATIGDLKALLASLCAADFSGTGDAAPVLTEIKMTAWGPMLHYDQIKDLDFPINNGEVGQPNDFSFVLVPPDLTHENWTYRNAQFLQFSRIDGFYDGSDATGFGWPRLGTQYYTGGLDFKIGDGSPAIHWPRFWRYWANSRWYYHDRFSQPFWLPVLNEFDEAQNYWTAEHVLVRSFYETKPLLDYNLLPVSRLNARLKRGISLLGKFDRSFDVYTRLAAWVNYEVLTVTWAGGLGWGPVVAVTEDFTDPTVQAAWFGGFNAATYDRGDSDHRAIEQNLLPLEVEHFNAAASAVNSICGAYTQELQPLNGVALREFYGSDTFECVPGRGLGSVNLRPRTQWVSWDHDANPEVTTKMTDQGLTVLTSADFPASLAAFLAESQTFWNGATPGLMYDTWADYILGTGGMSLDDFNTLLSNYRWVTIEDAIAFHDRKKFALVMEEVVFPCSLVIVDSGESGGDGALPAKAAGLVNDEEGEWVRDIAGGTYGPFMKSDLTPDRDCIHVWGDSFSGFNMTTFDFGEVGQTLRLAIGLPTPPQVGPPGGLSGMEGTRLYCKWVLVRRYGSAPARIILWPRNYAKYTPGYESDLETARAVAGTAGGMAGIPRIAVDDLEDAGPTVIDFPRVDPMDEESALLDEFIVTAVHENGELQVFRDARLLTTD